MRRILIALTATLALAGAAHAEELVVEVTGVKNDDGSIRVAIYKDAAGFLKDEGMVANATVPAASGEVSLTFSDMLPGAYAIALYHDEDGDNELTSNILGIPTEGVGFSNGARAGMSAPKYEDARFRIHAGTRHVERIAVSY